jgi:hypothetical protein
MERMVQDLDPYSGKPCGIKDVCGKVGRRCVGFSGIWAKEEKKKRRGDGREDRRQQQRWGDQ